MGSFKKFIWSLMTIVLILFGGSLIAFTLVDSQIRDDIISRLDHANYRYGLIICGAILLVFALILLVDIIIHNKEDREYLIESNSGDIYITRSSLEGLVESSVNKFPNARLDDVDVVIVGKEKIKVDLDCDVFGLNDYAEMGQLIQKEVEIGLTSLTGIEDVVVNLQLNKAESSHARELR
ncbi:MAG: alkaline shock response membrane anchor protein AmaP [Anaerococcus sp.]